MTLFRILAFVLLTQTAFATDLRDLAADFLLNKHDIEIEMQSENEGARALFSRDLGCIEEPSAQACIEFVAGSYPTTNERKEAALSCVGNYGADCTIFLAGSYPTTRERQDAAKACKGNRGVECATFVAGLYPTSKERLDAVKACAHADVECVKYIAGSYPNTKQRLDAAKACGGQ